MCYLLYILNHFYFMLLYNIILQHNYIPIHIIKYKHLLILLFYHYINIHSLLYYLFYIYMTNHSFYNIISNLYYMYNFLYKINFLIHSNNIHYYLSQNNILFHFNLTIYTFLMQYKS